MTISLKVFIENSEKIITLDDPITLNSCSKMFVNSINIFWNYDNLKQNIHHYTYDTKGANTKINLKDGYYTFDLIKTEFENVGDIELEKVDYSGKCKIQSDKELNLQTFAPILGFPVNKVISPNTWVESDNEVNINNNLDYVSISCNMIDKSQNFVNGKRSDILIQIPITTHQNLKGSVSRIYPPEGKGIKLSNGIYNEIKFKVEGNNSAYIGKVLLEMTINKRVSSTVIKVKKM